MSWRVERSESFDKWWKKESVSDSNYESYKIALTEFQNIPLPHNVQTRIFGNPSYECWVTRQPDKNRKTGKSHGFRVVMVLDLEEKILWLQGIFRRDHLDFEGSSGKHEAAYQTLLADLFSEFGVPKH